MDVIRLAKVLSVVLIYTVGAASHENVANCFDVS